MTGLLVCLIVMHKQQWLLRNKDLGYRKDLLVTLNIPFNGRTNTRFSRMKYGKFPVLQAYPGQTIYPRKSVVDNRV